MGCEKCTRGMSGSAAHGHHAFDDEGGVDAVVSKWQRGTWARKHWRASQWTFPSTSTLHIARLWSTSNEGSCSARRTHHTIYQRNKGCCAPDVTGFLWQSVVAVLELLF